MEIPTAALCPGPQICPICLGSAKSPSAGSLGVFHTDEAAIAGGKLKAKVCKREPSPAARQRPGFRGNRRAGLFIRMRFGSCCDPALCGFVHDRRLFLRHTLLPCCSVALGEPPFSPSMEF